MTTNIIPCKSGHLYVCALANGLISPDMVRIPILAWTLTAEGMVPITSDGPVDIAGPWIMYDDKLGQFLAKPGNNSLTWNQAKELLEQLYAVQ
jgi:hypothetical protein